MRQQAAGEHLVPLGLEAQRARLAVPGVLDERTQMETQAYPGTQAGGGGDGSSSPLL